jgi:hypothetical protein
LIQLGRERGILVGDQTKEQLLEKLSDMFKKKPEIQSQIIREFQMLITNGGLFTQIIDFFPYPIAIFTPQHTLAMVNKAFMAETKTRFLNFERETVRILQYRIDDTQLAAAIKQVFAGDTFYFENLKDPFSMFSGIARQSVLPPSGRNTKAVVFPVPGDAAEITHGVIMFLP